MAETIKREWITVKAASELAQRHESRIRRWIYDDRLATREDDNGVTRVLSTDVIELEARMTRRKNNKRRDTPGINT